MIRFSFGSRVFHCKLSAIHPVDHHSFSSSSWFLRLDCLTGAVLAWFAIYPYISRVTLVESGTNVVPRPSFLFYSVPPENRHGENTSGVLLPRRSGGSRSSSMAAGRCWLFERCCRPRMRWSLFEHCRWICECCRPLMRWSLFEHRRWIYECSCRLFERHPLFATPNGQRFHCDTGCRGLRNAHTVHCMDLVLINPCTAITSTRAFHDQIVVKLESMSHAQSACMACDLQECSATTKKGLELKSR